jgi:hypothetical protein
MTRAVSVEAVSPAIVRPMSSARRGWGKPMFRMGSATIGARDSPVPLQGSPRPDRPSVRLLWIRIACRSLRRLARVGVGSRLCSGEPQGAFF